MYDLRLTLEQLEAVIDSLRWCLDEGVAEVRVVEAALEEAERVARS